MQLFLLLILQIINAKLDRSKIMRELNRSVYAYDGVDASDPERYLRDYLWVKSSTVLILDGVVVVDKHFIHYAATQEKIDKHLAFVTSVATKLPNAVYQFSDDSTGACHAGDPCLVIAKSHAARDGVMIPNPYFANVDDWRDFRAVLQHAANARTWEHRRKRAFWRGSISPHDDKKHREADCLKNFGSFARLAAAAQTLAAPNEVDVKCISHAPPHPCALRKDPHFCDGVAGAPPQNYTEAIAAAVRRPEKITAKGPSNQVDYAAYRFLLNLPGSTHGSYSWNLNHLWSLGSVVLQWDMDAVEFYYPALEDGATHVVVDAETLAPTVKALQGDAARAKALRDGAREVHREVTCPECLAGYFGDVLRAIRERWGTARLLDDPCALRDFFADPATAAAVGCGDLELVEIQSAARGKLEHRNQGWRHSLGSRGKRRLRGHRHRGRKHSETLETASHYGQLTRARMDAKPLYEAFEGCGWIVHHAGKLCDAR